MAACLKQQFDNLPGAFCLSGLVSGWILLDARNY
jgi:hypothetical protein